MDRNQVYSKFVLINVSKSLMTSILKSVGPG